VPVGMKQGASERQGQRANPKMGIDPSFCISDHILGVRTKL